MNINKNKKISINEIAIESDLYERSLKLPNGDSLNLSTSTENEVGIQMIESINRFIPNFPKKFKSDDLFDETFYRDVLEHSTGSRNCTYILNTIYNNIVTPIEKDILASRNDPTVFKDILKYMCEEIVKGRVDDWNDTNNLRIRLSEMFTGLLNKQITAAYNEYSSKYLAGDKKAKIYINPTKIFSEIINSQNVSPLENINPIEEIANFTRVTPVGLGGVKTGEAWPKQARNLHHSYFGNIDPLETPDGPGVGITQHLAAGAALTNRRGLFSQRDKEKIRDLEILSPSALLIPFVEKNDGNRVLMATGQSKQIIPLKNPETPAVMTGFESTLTNHLSESFIKKSPVNGEVTEVTKLQISIKDREGNIHTVDISPMKLYSGQGKTGMSDFKAIVKVGQKVKQGQFVAEGANIKDGMIANGINLLCAWLPWKGYNFEDGMVVTESVAKRFLSVHIEEKDVYLTEEDDISHIANIGDKMGKGDILLSFSPTSYDVETLNHLRSDGGTVANIEVFSNVEEDEIPDMLKPVYDDFRDRYVNIHGNYPIGKFKEKDNSEKFKGIYIRFTIQNESKLTHGDKINIRHFNKGVVSEIIPDSLAPLTPWGDPIDIIYTTLSMINRMNPGQLFEMYIGLISRNLALKIEKLSRAQFTKIYSDVMNILDSTKDKTWSKTAILRLKSASNETYEQLKKNVIKDKFVPMTFPPFKSPGVQEVKSALQYLDLKTKYKLYLPEYRRWTDPVSMGYMYVFKLEHQSEKKIYARSVGGYKMGTLQPTAGKRRGGGQKIGEGDLYALLSWDVPTVIDEFFGPLSADHVTKYELISEIVQTGKTSYREPKTNPINDIFSQLLKSIHIQVE